MHRVECISIEGQLGKGTRVEEVAPHLQPIRLRVVPLGSFIVAFREACVVACDSIIVCVLARFLLCVWSMTLLK